MSFTFRPAKREHVPLLLGVAGGTGSGKTYSALLIARGIAGGEPFAFVDTENGRALHYADQFPEMQHGDLRAPFRPDAYVNAILAGHRHLENVPAHKRVVVVDSFSHEWTGDGGCLDWVDEITGGDQKKKGVAWATVKPAHRKMMTKLLALDAHVIVCLRAEYGKVDIVRKDGKTEFVPKKTLPGGSLNDWYPLSEKAFPYELTASFLVVADAPGVPLPLKLQEQHKPMVPLDRPLGEETGRRLAEWAAGGDTQSSSREQSSEQPGSGTDSGRAATSASHDADDSERESLTASLMDLADQLGNRENVERWVTRNREEKPPDAHIYWLYDQIEKATQTLAAKEISGEDAEAPSEFERMAAEAQQRGRSQEDTDGVDRAGTA